MAAGTVARPKVLYSCWRREHGSGTFKDSLGQPRVSHVSAIHQGLAVVCRKKGFGAWRSIVCSCGLVSVPFVTTALLVRLSFIAWVRWMQYALRVRLRIVSYISRLPSDSELLVLHLRVRVKTAVKYVYTPASTARASAVIPVSPSSSPPGRPGA
ncbi:uncharacterized protein B0T23DRAFT_404309 [Neurospora hispaniola]|uniref:Uncharacterized protein n=1 Tax=Neurospora hispaniola TaxID=588809 RepID=A0AAJ0I772_9PEZI|nr:hypothetical protein B0T23DRAFT_404309 [Neurospora hispaniola]